MANLVFGMNQSLDGYVDHMKFGPSPRLFDHFIEQVRNQAGSLYGRTLYELMHYWDQDRAEWGPPERDWAEAWRRSPKWVVSKTLKDVGPNATLIKGDLETAVRKIKQEVEGEVEVGGPQLAAKLTELGLIDEYRLYLHPVVLGSGTPMFGGPRTPLRLKEYSQVDDDVLKLIYVPA